MRHALLTMPRIHPGKKFRLPGLLKYILPYFFFCEEKYVRYLTLATLEDFLTLQHQLPQVESPQVLLLSGFTCLLCVTGARGHSPMASWHASLDVMSTPQLSRSVKPNFN